MSSATVYAASEGLHTVLLERHAVGGQAGTSSLIENYLGFPGGISGARLAERARQQAVAFGAEILLLQEGINATFRDARIVVDLAAGGTLTARANICATGVEYNRLNLPCEDTFTGAGLYYGEASAVVQRELGASLHRHEVEVQVPRHIGTNGPSDTATATNHH